MYKIRCYKRNGEFDHEEFFTVLKKAIARRKEWGINIGLRPEPSTDFAYYPTIWKRRNDMTWNRIEGY